MLGSVPCGISNAGGVSVLHEKGCELKPTNNVLKLAQKGVPPPFVPTGSVSGLCGGGGGDDEHFTYNFDAQFTREPAVLTPDDA